MNQMNHTSEVNKKTCRIASWNINSVRLRIDLIERLIEAHSIDILCLQETKVVDELFPLEALNAMGFTHCAFRGEKSYNGVAILSKQPLSDIRYDCFGGIDQARHISATLPDGTVLHNIYIPAGGDIADPDENPKFAHKLAFLKDLTEWSQTLQADEKRIIVGDFNIAPFEHDVWSSKQLRKVVSHTDIEREKLAALKQAGHWTDTHRHFIPEDEKLYSWWSYRSRDWQTSNRGRRLDHIWVTQPLKDQLHAVETLTDVRGWERPSDHVPIITSLHMR